MMNIVHMLLLLLHANTKAHFNASKNVVSITTHANAVAECYPRPPRLLTFVVSILPTHCHSHHESIDVTLNCLTLCYFCIGAGAHMKSQKNVYYIFIQFTISVRFGIWNLNSLWMLEWLVLAEVLARKFHRSSGKLHINHISNWFLSFRRSRSTTWTV